MSVEKKDNYDDISGSQGVYFWVKKERRKMDYGENDVFGAVTPTATGIAAVGLTLGEKIMYGALIVAAVIAIALVIRLYWRRNKSIGDK